MSEALFIDVTILEPKMKHPTIFDAFDSILNGESVVIHNDHDPKPLYYQLLGERGNCFSWTYLLNGPDIWEVEIKKDGKHGETVGEIAAKDMRKAELLKKLGIDFCCGGKKTIEEACTEKGLDVIRVKKELEDSSQEPTGQTLDFNSFTASFLIDYIVNVHHAFVNKNLPILFDLSQKVGAHHGQTMPFLVEVGNKVNDLRCELVTHMKKEEQILFPSIKLQESKADIKLGFERISEPIFVMEGDHESVGDTMRALRKLTNDYNVPDNACNSIRMLYFKLEEFENDLYQHIHLENNILFPKALALEK